MKKIIPAVIVSLLLAASGCKKKDNTETHYGETGGPSSTTGSPPTGGGSGSGGGLTSVDIETLYGFLISNQVEMETNGSVYNSKQTFAFFNTDFSEDNLKGIYAGTVSLNGSPLSFDATSDPLSYSSSTFPNDESLTWAVQGANGIPALYYNVPKSSIGFSELIMEQNVKQGSAFTMTVSDVSGHHASLELSSNINNVTVAKTLKNGTNLVKISAAESQSLSAQEVRVSIACLNQYLAPGGAKKFLVQQQKSYSKLFKFNP